MFCVLSAFASFSPPPPCRSPALARSLSLPCLSSSSPSLHSPAVHSRRSCLTASALFCFLVPARHPPPTSVLYTPRPSYRHVRSMRLRSHHGRRPFVRSSACPGPLPLAPCVPGSVELPPALLALLLPCSLAATSCLVCVSTPPAALPSPPRTLPPQI